MNIKSMQVTPNLRTRHRKTGGHYRVIGLALIEATHQDVVVYRSEETGQLWVRPLVEFADGRFETVDDTPPDAGPSIAGAGDAPAST